MGAAGAIAKRRGANDLAQVDKTHYVYAMADGDLHERLRELLGSAKAEGCNVVATFLDIRGFSSFSSQGQSFDAALYLRAVYQIILSEYFNDATFFKPTGDGLLLIHELPTDREDVPALVSSILSRATDLVTSFGEITNDDYMINFPVPQKLGVGIARGSATRLVSDGGVLDYTGRCLNLASRLMDKARPFGVVFSDSRADQLLTSEVSVLFGDDAVCLRGISEQLAVPILVSAGVEIEESDREPVLESRRTYGDEVTMSVSETRASSRHGFYLRRVPHSYERVGVHVEYPLFDDAGKKKGTVSWLDVYGDYLEQPNGALVTIDLEAVKHRIRDIPESVTGKVLGWTKTTRVNFTPFIEPSEVDES